jgi:hypothetical protein
VLRIPIVKVGESFFRVLLSAAFGRVDVFFIRFRWSIPLTNPLCALRWREPGLVVFSLSNNSASVRLGFAHSVSSNPTTFVLNCVLIRFRASCQSIFAVMPEKGPEPFLRPVLFFRFKWRM